jgi:hypothetical protein
MSILIEFLQGLGNAATFLIVVGVLVGVSIVLPRLRQRLGITLHKEMMDGASDAYKAVASSMIFVLAFAVYQVQGNFRNAEISVEKEAAQLNLMDRALTRYGSAEATAVRGLEIEYANLVITKEWPLMQRSGRSDEVDQAFEKLTAAPRNLIPENPAQQAQLGAFQRALDETSDLREARLSMTSKSLPSLYWATIAGLLILLIVLVAFTSATWDKLPGHAGQICAVGLLLSLVIIIDGPFRGDTSVPPDAIAQTLKVIQARHAPN